MNIDELPDAIAKRRERMRQEAARFQTGKNGDPHVFTNVTNFCKEAIGELEAAGDDGDLTDDVLALADTAKAYNLAFPHPTGRQTQADPPGGYGLGGDGAQRLHNFGSGMIPLTEFAAANPASLDAGEFDGLADFARSVHRQRTGYGSDQRLVNYSASQSGSDTPSGGFLVPPRFVQEIITSGGDADEWLNLVDRQMLPDGFGKLVIPAIADRDRTGQDVAGMALTRRSEGSTVPESTITLERQDIELDSAGTIVNVSNELLQDAVPGSVDDMLRQTFAAALNQRLSLDVVGNSTGTIAGGILSSGGTYVVAKESMQTANTINATNVLKMDSRLKASSRGNAVWLASPDAKRQLVSTEIESENAAGAYWLFRPGNGTSEPDTLLGRPIFFSEACSALGDKGDLILADLSQFRHIMRGPFIDSSPHINFDTNEVAFRYLIRDRGEPKHDSTYKTISGYEQASFVALAERA